VLASPSMSSFRLLPGELAFLVGRSGAGKSTLLKLITARSAHDGRLWVAGMPAPAETSRVAELRRRVGVVFQDTSCCRDFAAKTSPSAPGRRPSRRTRGKDASLDAWSGRSWAMRDAFRTSFRRPAEQRVQSPCGRRRRSSDRGQPQATSIRDGLEMMTFSRTSRLGHGRPCRDPQLEIVTRLQRRVLTLFTADWCANQPAGRREDGVRRRR